MTAKEKAKELINKYFKESDLLYEDLTWTQAKECALITVDEILNVIEDNCLEYDDNYWQEVKQELEKL
jgi:preprotein translocase subunit SecE